jgi:hypothetical protein
MATALLLTNTAAAQATKSPRWDVSMGITNWSALEDLQLPSQGSFDSGGLDLGGSIHFPATRSGNNTLYVGFDSFVHVVDSSAWVTYDNLMLRHLYIGVSGKWAFTSQRDFYLDGGIGYHVADISQTDAELFGDEFEHWSESKVGGYVGVTWDIGRGTPGRRGGVFVSLRAHFVDLGTVRDEQYLNLPVLGPNAGTLDGPLYMLNLGYSRR